MGANFVYVYEIYATHTHTHTHIYIYKKIFRTFFTNDNILTFRGFFGGD